MRLARSAVLKETAPMSLPVTESLTEVTVTGGWFHFFPPGFFGDAGVRCGCRGPREPAAVKAAVCRGVGPVPPAGRPVAGGGTVVDVGTSAAVGTLWTGWAWTV
jgi:hypothetical protein